MTLFLIAALKTLICYIIYAYTSGKESEGWCKFTRAFNTNDVRIKYTVSYKWMQHSMIHCYIHSKIEEPSEYDFPFLAELFYYKVYTWVI